MRGGTRVDEDVVVDGAVPAAANHRGPRDLVEQVAEDFGTAELIVQVHSHTAVALETVDVMEVVVADDRARAWSNCGQHKLPRHRSIRSRNCESRYTQ